MRRENATIVDVTCGESARGVAYLRIDLNTDSGNRLVATYSLDHEIGQALIAELHTARRGRRVRAHTWPDQDHGFGLRVIGFSPPRSRLVEHTLPTLLRRVADRLEDGRRV